MRHPELQKAYELLLKAEKEIKNAKKEGIDYLPALRTGRKLFRAMDKGLNVVLKHYGIPTDIEPDEKFDKLYRYDKVMAQHYMSLAGEFLAPYGKKSHVDSLLIDIKTIKAMFREIEKHLSAEKV